MKFESNADIQCQASVRQTERMLNALEPNVTKSVATLVFIQIDIESISKIYNVIHLIVPRVPIALPTSSTIQFCVKYPPYTPFYIILHLHTLF